MIACGHAPLIEVRPGTATTIATGGVVPRGADAVVMVEHTELIESVLAIELRRTLTPGQFISYAGSDIARGEVVLRRGARIGSREIGMLRALRSFSVLLGAVSIILTWALARVLFTTRLVIADAAVVALGDLGRSARMQYHAHVLATSGLDVDLVGFSGTTLPRLITADSDRKSVV